MPIIPSSGSTPKRQAPPRRQAEAAGAAGAAQEGRLLGTETQPGDWAVETGLRPQRLADYTGQKALKALLSVAIDACRQRGDALDHVLLYGPPGLGKTTMAQILASELGVSARITSAPALERPRDIAGLLASLQPRDVLFIDEIHRLSRTAEEILYPAMEDFALDITIGKGPAARTKRLPLPPFTLVGATTKAGSLSGPLRDRFGLVHRLEFYADDELSSIVMRAAELLRTPMTGEGALAIARRARGTPRVANRLLKRVRDYAAVGGHGPVSAPVAEAALDALGVDPLGLDATDRALLTAMLVHHRGGPVGLETMAASISEDPVTVEDVYEPFLLQKGLLARTPRGRVVTDTARAHLEKA